MKNTIKKTLLTTFITSFTIIAAIAIFLIIDDMMHAEVKNFFDSLYYIIDYHFINYEYYHTPNGITMIIAIIVIITLISFLYFSLKED